MKILSKLKLLFTPTDEWDAVNKKYVDDLVSSKGEVKGVKGEAETEYKTGLVNIAPENIGVYSKTEIDNFISDLTDKIEKINEMISSGNITTIDKIIDNDGNIIVTNTDEPLEIVQRTS